jgi:hypothetical protein
VSLAEQTTRRIRPARRRFRRWNPRNLPMMLVITMVAASLAYSAAVPPHWLRGVLGIAGAMLLAGFLRLVLPARQAGLLAVRSRLVDVVFYGGIGGMIIFLGVTLAAAGQV